MVLLLCCSACSSAGSVVVSHSEFRIPSALFSLLQVVGTAKDTIGSLTGNNQQQAKGKAQEVCLAFWKCCACVILHMLSSALHAMAACIILILVEKQAACLWLKYVTSALHVLAGLDVRTHDSSPICCRRRAMPRRPLTPERRPPAGALEHGVIRKRLHALLRSAALQSSDSMGCRILPA